MKKVYICVATSTVSLSLLLPILPSLDTRQSLTCLLSMSPLKILGREDVSHLKENLHIRTSGKLGFYFYVKCVINFRFVIKKFKSI